MGGIKIIISKKAATVMTIAGLYAATMGVACYADRGSRDDSNRGNSNIIYRNGASSINPQFRELYKDFQANYNDSRVTSASSMIRVMMDNNTDSRTLAGYMDTLSNSVGSRKSFYALLKATMPVNTPVPTESDFSNDLNSALQSLPPEYQQLLSSNMPVTMITDGNKLAAYQAAQFEFAKPVPFFVLSALARGYKQAMDEDNEAKKLNPPFVPNRGWNDPTREKVRIENPMYREPPGHTGQNGSVNSTPNGNSRSGESPRSYPTGSTDMDKSQYRQNVTNAEQNIKRGAEQLSGAIGRKVEEERKNLPTQAKQAEGLKNNAIKGLQETAGKIIDKKKK